MTYPHPTEKIAVVGGAISGPACALAFRRAGYEAECYEARDEVTTTSAGVLGLRPWNLNVLADLGIPRDAIVVHPGIASRRHTVAGRQVVARRDVQLPSKKATWSVLHRALDREFPIQYGTRITERPDADLVVWADGIGSTGRRRLDPGHAFHYAGYTAFRAVSDVEPEFSDWAVFEEDGQFLMNVVPTSLPDGSPRVEWTVFLPWPYQFKRYDPQIKCAVDGSQPCDNTTAAELHALLRQLLPSYQMSIVDATSGPIAAVSIGDWDMPQRMVFDGEVVIGDALCAMRPHTSMSANLGLGEGMSLPRAYADGELDYWQASWLADVEEQRGKGAALGTHYAITLEGASA